MRRAGLVLAAMAFALLLVVGAANAADLGRVQAESTASLSGYGGTKFHESTATGQSGTVPNALRYETNGGPPAYTLDVGPGEGASAVVVRSRVPATNDSAVGINVVVDGQAQAAKSIGRTATSYAERSWPVTLPPGQHTVRVTGSGLTAAADDLITDYVRLEGTAAPDADLDGVPDSQEVQGHGGYDDALTHESMTELKGFIAWLDQRPGYSGEGYIGETGWPQHLSNGGATAEDADRWNALGETWYRRADAAGLSVTAQGTSERYANSADGGYFSSVYMQCGNLQCPGYREPGTKPLPLVKPGHQARVLERHQTTGVYFRGTNFEGGQEWTRGVTSAQNRGTYGDNPAGENWYFYPTTEEPSEIGGVNSYEYLASRGVTHVRLGFRWERVQPTLYGPLDATEMAHYKESVRAADAAGLKVIADMHNYGGYWATTSGGCDANPDGTGGTGKLCLGSAALPKAAFVDVWDRLSAELRGEPGVFMYDLMNEPSGADGIRAYNGTNQTWTVAETWEDLTEGVVDSVRSSGDNTAILVPSYEAGVERTPERHPGGPWITDQPNLYWGAHQYHDHYVGPGTGGGQYKRSYAFENDISDHQKDYDY